MGKITFLAFPTRNKGYVHHYGEKSVWLINCLFSALKCMIQVSQTSIDLRQQFAASFKEAHF
jgi:hypothetical protein